MVTISTRSWVTARSGADSQTKVRQVTSPAPPTSTSAAKRWYFACQAAATRAGRADRPEHREQRVEARRRAGRSRSAPQSIQPAGAERDEHEDAQLRLQPLGAEPAGRAARAQTQETVTSTRSKMRWPLSAAEERRPLGLAARSAPRAAQ